jgi:hypothetical protein
MTAAKHGSGAAALEATAAGRRVVSAALLAALETARWPDGSRLVDVSDQTIHERLVPALTDELIARLAVDSHTDSDIDTRAAT